MPRFIIERDVGTLSREELDAAGRRSNAALEAMSGVVWIRSYVSDVDGKIY
ncbi:MAG: nickel-binding protein, partial [Longimicrobiales bacterium]